MAGADAARTVTPADERWMQRALSLVRASVGLTSPNPQVGCVLVRDGVLVGEGEHWYDRRDHAEIVALKQAGDAAGGATAYVTLEPCSFTGRTGPCAEALIAAGIARCVVATLDPNPKVSGQGIARLEQAGIQTVVGVLEAQARTMNDAFAWSIRHGRPFVTLKAALSADGHLAPPLVSRTAKQPHWLTGPESRADVQRMRHASDAILTGIGTVLADNPALTDRTGLPRRRPLLRVVLDTELRTPHTSQLLRSVKPAAADLLVVCQEGASGVRELTALGVEVLPVSQEGGRLNVQAVLDELGKRQIISLLLEAGSRVNGAFLAENLVQQAVLFYAETELGHGAIPFAQGFESPFLLEQRLRKVQRTRFGADVCVSGYLHDPWGASVVG